MFVNTNTMFVNTVYIRLKIYTYTELQIELYINNIETNFNFVRLTLGNFHRNLKYQVTIHHVKNSSINYIYILFSILLN
jgi:hypothetical protein